MATGLTFCLCRFCKFIQLPFLCSLISFIWNYNLHLFAPSSSCLLLSSAVLLSQTLCLLSFPGARISHVSSGCIFFGFSLFSSPILFVFHFTCWFPSRTFGNSQSCHSWKIDCAENKAQAGIGQQMKDIWWGRFWPRVLKKPQSSISISMQLAQQWCSLLLVKQQSLSVLSEHCAPQEWRE